MSMDKVLVSPAPLIRTSVTAIVSTDTLFHEVLGPSEKRKTVCFLSLDSWVVQPAPGTFPRSAALLVINPATTFVFRYEDFGSIVQGSWFAAANAAALNLLIMEGLEI